jgi:hypothetical protein
LTKSPMVSSICENAHTPLFLVHVNSDVQLKIIEVDAFHNSLFYLS